MRVHSKTLILATLLAFLFGCGSKNETGAPPPAPIQGIGFQQTNMLDTFDPSFESATNIDRRGGTNANHFQINSRDRLFRQFEITEIAAHSGQKSLRIYEPHKAVFFYPVLKNSTSRDIQSPLTIVPGAKYRLELKLRLPRSTSRTRAMRVNVTSRYTSESTTLRNIFTELNPMESQGVDNNNWETFTLELDAPLGVSNLRLSFSFGRVEELLVDSFSLIRIN